MDLTYEVINIRTGLTKLIYSKDWASKDLALIKNFYNNHKDYLIKPFYKRKSKSHHLGL